MTCGVCGVFARRDDRRSPAVDHTADNLRRLMARMGISRRNVAERTGLDPRTVRGLLRGEKRTRPETLSRLAEGLGVAVDELFLAPAQLAYQTFDRRTNPVVDEVVADHPELFAGWSEAEFAELTSHFGEGGRLTAEGALTVARRMNHRRELIEKLILLLETSQAETIAGIVEMLYDQVVLRGEQD